MYGQETYRLKPSVSGEKDMGNWQCFVNTVMNTQIP